MSGIRLEDLGAALTALRLLVLDHPELPAPTASVSPIYPDRLRLDFHDDAADFEAWREALDADPATVVLRRWGVDGGALTVCTAYAGATVELIGYLALPVREELAGRAA
ncbi:hypothetical protein [Streptomyces sp. SPB074]|uniref:hypothetical protein n=1 Tax=Streptomyces sp. (strain SPB074) TaxID=465543 RepID=UPI0005602AF3|nr:hypothetical protein [Streptomyces sp. SPB074]